jgi:hypothetical protein
MTQQYPAVSQRIQESARPKLEPQPTTPRLKIDRLHHPHFPEISESQCGPAVIQMLLGHLGFEVSQEAIAAAGGAAELNGMRVDQLARAVRLLAPHAQFWCKENASSADLTRLVNDFRYPVGVEWQGTTEDRLEEDGVARVYGHYSVAIIVDEKNRQLVIVDPYKDFRAQDRIFDLDWFVTRWYDLYEVEISHTGKRHSVEDRRLLFIITPADETFPRELGMKNDL